jgi:hypothetical protein
MIPAPLPSTVWANDDIEDKSPPRRFLVSGEKGYHNVARHDIIIHPITVSITIESLAGHANSAHPVTIQHKRRPMHQLRLLFLDGENRTLVRKRKVDAVLISHRGRRIG